MRSSAQCDSVNRQTYSKCHRTAVTRLGISHGASARRSQDMDRLVLENSELNVRKIFSEGQTAKYTGVYSPISYKIIIHEIVIRIFTIHL